MLFEKYKKYGDYHWRQYAKGTKYKKHADRIKVWVKESNILDIGAGDGLITSLIGAKGVDNEMSGVKIAQEKGVDVVFGDAYNLDFKDESFDAVTMIDVLEHFEFPEKALAEAHRVCKLYTYISTPPKRDDGKLTDKYHYIEWTPEGLNELMKSNGFEMIGTVLSIKEEKVMYGKFKKV